ncbi:hypothetical protein GCM10027055_06970 [Janibacter alkaliphilus]
MFILPAASLDATDQMSPIRAAVPNDTPQLAGNNVQSRLYELGPSLQSVRAQRRPVIRYCIRGLCPGEAP